MTQASATQTPGDAPRRHRRFKRFIILLTLAAVAGTVASFRIGRFYAVEGYTLARAEIVRRLTGLEPDRAAIEAGWTRRRELAIEGTREANRKFYARTDEDMRNLFRAAGMDPEHGLVRSGRADQAMLFSSQVFEADEHGRSYRLRPNTRSVWLRQVTILDGPFGLFQVVDDPSHREAAARARAIVDEGSVTTTNSWGLRGPEPDPTAPLRGIVLGDSFMQGMFNGDAETPPAYLASRLEALYGVRASIANTGHIGYSPEQYYYSLLEYGDRMKPDFVVVSVCPNDFGDAFAMFEGRADWLDEAAYWIEKVNGWCRARSRPFLLVPVPTYPQVENNRKDGFYPGLVSNAFHGPPSSYCDPLEQFIDENLRLRLEAAKAGGRFARSPLFNRQIDDEHLSPKGAELWAEIVARRLMLLLETSGRATNPALPLPRVTSTPAPTEPPG